MTLESVVGIIKFFRETSHLEAFESGILHCNTPEYYRLCETPGASDYNECVTHAYRQERGDPEPTVMIEGQSLPNLTRVTLRSTGQKDGWLHCWSLVTTPNGEEETAELLHDMLRMAKEFGPSYAYIGWSNLESFLDRIRSVCSHDVTAQAIAYSADSLEWSPFCKDQRFTYQREFRVLIGECDEHSRDRLVLTVPSGFHDLAEKHLAGVCA